MNIIKSPGTKPKFKKTTLARVCTSGETAFIGRCGVGPSHSLYLIYFDGIIFANNPSESWERSGCPVEVEQYVDLEIAVKLKPKKKPLKRL